MICFHTVHYKPLQLDRGRNFSSANDQHANISLVFKGENSCGANAIFKNLFHTYSRMRAAERNCLCPEFQHVFWRTTETLLLL